MSPLRDVIRTVGATALIAFGLGTPGRADPTVPEAYQGVWAAAHDCEQNLQTVLPDVVNRRSAACRVTRIVGAGGPEPQTNAVYLNCGGSESREIWDAERVEDTDYLIIIRFERAAAATPSIDMYKRCPGIPLKEITLSEIPGNPVADTASGEKTAPSPHAIQVRQHPFPHSRATRIRKRRPQ